MRIAVEEYSSHGWRVDEIASDFELVDAWKLPVTGEQADFDVLRRVWAETTREQRRAGPVKLLFAVRERVGKVFTVDATMNTEPIPGTELNSLRERLPSDLLDAVPDPHEQPPFRTVFVSDTESASELSNSLLHAILHLGWAQQPDDSYSGYLGVFVKHRGRLGRPYMTFIAPFRHYLVYPALMKRIGRNWAARPEAG